MSQVDAPVVSIVIPCYNARSVLQPCLQSIFDLPPKRRFEVIVVNDGSTDGTPEMVRELFPKVRLLNNPENLGYSRSTNRGIEAAEGRFIHLLNSDVVFPEAGAVDRLAEHLERHEEVGAAGTLLYNLDGTVQASVKALPSFLSAVFGARSFVSTRWPENRFTRRELLHWKAEAGGAFPAGYISSASLMIPRDLLRRIGKLDPVFFHFADADLCKRIQDGGRSVVCVPQAKAVHDAHKGGTTESLSRRFRGVANFHMGAYRYYRKHSGTAAWHPARLAAAAGLALRAAFAFAGQVVEETVLLFRPEAPSEDTAASHFAAKFANAGKDSNVDVSVIVASYNSRVRLQACLESLYSCPNQTNVEISVIDDASSDGGAEMVRRLFPQARLHENPSNLG